MKQYLSIELDLSLQAGLTLLQRALETRDVRRGGAIASVLLARGASLFPPANNVRR